MLNNGLLVIGLFIIFLFLWFCVSMFECYCSAHDAVRRRDQRRLKRAQELNYKLLQENYELKFKKEDNANGEV